jgi:hypothetical protein
MAKSIKKYQSGGKVKTTSASKKYIDQADKNLTESIRGYSQKDTDEKEKQKNLADIKAREARVKYPKAASTYVKSYTPKMKMGGSCSTPKRLKK